MRPERVFVVRSGPNLTRVTPVDRAGALKRRGSRYLVGYVGVIGEQEGHRPPARGGRHIVHERGRNDVQFAIVGEGTGAGAAARRCRRARRRRLRRLHRPRRRRRALRDPRHRRCLRQPGPRQRDERQVDHEQDHGVHGARQADRAVRPDGGSLLGGDASLYAKAQRRARFCIEALRAAR